MAQGPSIVVGLDFGTTFSGIAWAFKGSADDIEVLSTWPGGGNRTSMKVPSTISYGARTTRWGYQVGPFMEAFRGLKLLLDEEQETTYPPSLCSKKLLAILDKDAVHVTADYLRYLVGYAQGVLERRLGIAASAMNLRYILTVPAVWSDKAKNCTLRAALKAGISPQDVSLKNDMFVVCDAGGGTVDLISYQIRALKPLAVREIVKGAGRICGSTLLDESFERMLEERLGPTGYAALSDKAKDAALHYWQDRVKPNFAGKYDEDFEDVDYFIPVPGALDDRLASIEDGFLYLTSDDVTSIFEPIVKEVESLVAEQIEGIKEKKLYPKVVLTISPSAIILVGGFGASMFLFHRLQEANPSVLVMQPPDAGAVHRGLDGNQVESRVVRRPYGVRCRSPYVAGQHDPNDMVWCHLKEEYEVHNCMHWYIEKSSVVSENKPVRVSFCRLLEASSEHGLCVKVDLLFSDSDRAPAMSNQTMRLCTVEADLSRIPRDLFVKKCNSKGVEYYEVYYDLVMIPTSASLLFELEFNGVGYGSVRSKY
ncbi:Hsp70 family protein [Aspergillus aculeatinus CBS 121060]|uniref:Uncharacterized protein n=1 Tax=Aspergillus aculeatinus CBS 121060 TaxID=1448322 RepID=A0ACD1GWJ5_9EURO|nr:hypothetical protein BO66DRAFT_461446 [Aspergillus aculeatinus CBS 121060]RAH65714.1 hypothetical protein BO66DRAFT_461446 [Aspergillus aculeatinus CBS 121060]